MSEEIEYNKLDDFKAELDKLANGDKNYNENLIQISYMFKLVKIIDDILFYQLIHEIKNRTINLSKETEALKKSRISQIKAEIKKVEAKIKAEAKAKAQAEKERLKVEARAQARAEKAQAKADKEAEAKAQALLVSQIEKDIAKIIINKFKIITFEENNKTHLYNNGVFLKAKVSETRINQEILRIVADKFDKYQESLSRRGMIMQVIKDLTPFPINNFKLFSNHLINVENGAIIQRHNGLKFITHENLIKHKKYLYTFIQFPIYYKEGARCPTINKMLKDIFGNDQIIDVMEFIAYILMPTLEYDKGMIIQGPPDTGETTFLELIKKFIGSKNYSMTELFRLGESFQMANLRNKAAIIADELTNKKWDEFTCSRLKRIITNDQLNSGIKFVQDDEDWWSRCKVLCAGNNLPDTAIKSDAWWKRWIIIFCLNKFGDDIKDSSLKNKNWSKEDKSGFLNECIRAWRRLSNRKGFRLKWRDYDYVKRQWLSNILPVAQFIETYCNLNDINQSIDYKKFVNKFNEYRRKYGLKEYTGNLITRGMILYNERYRPIQVNKKSHPKSSGYEFRYLGWNGQLEAEKDFETLKAYENSQYVEFEKEVIIDKENTKIYDGAVKKAV